MGNSSRSSPKHLKGAQDKSIFQPGPFQGRLQGSLLSHIYVLPIPAEPMCPKGLLNEEMTVLPTQELMDNNQKLENQNCFPNRLPTS